MAADREMQIMEALVLWNSGDLSSVTEILTEDFVFQPSGSLPGVTEPFHGPEGMRQFWSEVTDPWQVLRYEALAFEHAAEDVVVVDVVLKATGREGIEVEMRHFHVWEFRAEKILAISSYAERDAALEAAGLA